MSPIEPTLNTTTATKATCRILINFNNGPIMKPVNKIHFYKSEVEYNLAIHSLCAIARHNLPIKTSLQLP